MVECRSVTWCRSVVKQSQRHSAAVTVLRRRGASSLYRLSSIFKPCGMTTRRVFGQAPPQILRAAPPQRREVQERYHHTTSPLLFFAGTPRSRPREPPPSIRLPPPTPRIFNTSPTRLQRVSDASPTRLQTRLHANSRTVLEATFTESNIDDTATRRSLCSVAA